MGPENLSRSRPENDHVHQLTNGGSMDRRVSTGP